MDGQENEQAQENSGRERGIMMTVQAGSGAEDMRPKFDEAQARATLQRSGENNIEHQYYEK